MDNDAIIPDVAEFTRKIVKEIEDTTPNVSTDEMWASLSKYNAWRLAVKPYLEDRIERLKTMSDINFSGKEKIEEIGIRYMICGGIAKELQDIINKVEVTKFVLSQQKKENADNQ